MKTILDRLKEPSTYRGLSLLLGLIGVSVSPEQATSIGTGVAAILSIIEIVRKEKPAA